MWNVDSIVNNFNTKSMNEAITNFTGNVLDLQELREDFTNSLKL